MQLQELSSKGLHLLHQAIGAALDQDDKAVQSNQLPPFGVRQYPDFRIYALAIEAELGARNEAVQPIAGKP